MYASLLGLSMGEPWALNSPVLVETTTAFLRQVLGPNVDQSTGSVRSFDVADGTDNNDWWSLQDGDGFNDFLLVDL